MKVVLALLAWLGSAAAAPGDNEAAFRRRNPQRWRVLTLDARGFVQHVRTDQPVEPAALLRASADLFGIDEADVDRLRGPRRHQRFVDAIDHAVLAAIDVRVTGGTTDIAVQSRVRATPTVREDDLRARLVDQRYAETTGWAPIPMLDCGMSPAGAAGCVTPIVHRETHDITLTRADVRVTTSLRAAPDGTPQLVRCADAARRPPRLLAYHRVRTRSYAPLAGAPRLPLVVDAVTGDAIATAARDCSDARLSNGRAPARSP